jgi:hypothetical protein
MGGWKQIGGDMSWERHGVVLGKLDPKARQVELVRITPWLEHDHEAAVSHGLYLVDSTTLDIDDLGIDQPNVREAMRSSGIDAAEFDALEPEYKAELLASYQGYEDSRSVNALAKALPAPVKDVAFWGGQESESNLAEYDRELRRESLEANFETRMTFGVMPADEAITFALGDGPFTMDLKGEDELAFEYATAAAGVSGDVDTAESFIETVKALAEAPLPSELDGAGPSVTKVISRWENRYGDPSDDDSGIANAAQSLASAMLDTLGFEWV